MRVRHRALWRCFSVLLCVSTRQFVPEAASWHNFAQALTAQAFQHRVCTTHVDAQLKLSHAVQQFNTLAQAANCADEGATHDAHASLKHHDNSKRRHRSVQG